MGLADVDKFVIVLWPEELGVPMTFKEERWAAGSGHFPENQRG